MFLDAEAVTNHHLTQAERAAEPALRFSLQRQRAPLLSEATRDGLPCLGTTTPIRTSHQEHFGYMGIMSSTRRLEMAKLLGLSLALLLLGSGIWANVGSGSFSENKGAWVSHANR
jgi:hypothetical protein